MAKGCRVSSEGDETMPVLHEPSDGVEIVFLCPWYVASRTVRGMVVNAQEVLAILVFQPEGMTSGWWTPLHQQSCPEP